jgi:hypothetical protein
LDNEVKDNPIYRIASAVYGVAPASLTDEQVAVARALSWLLTTAPALSSKHGFESESQAPDWRSACFSARAATVIRFD